MNEFNEKYTIWRPYRYIAIYHTYIYINTIYTHIVSDGDPIRNEEISRGSRDSSTGREAKVAMGGTPIDVGVPWCWNGDPATVRAELADQNGEQMIKMESLGIAGNKLPWTVDFGTLQNINHSK
ncbi:jg26135 [Pararge aegeria aegeria]|uniref:Jg26135 protein n=1 Tax=Pararge aegeria aegeria TaxID=348720 RepID=A0A8S4S768_9NEOP|nr:jg26135 [Pararge aegeria aegeria]